MECGGNGVEMKAERGINCIEQTHEAEASEHAGG